MTSNSKPVAKEALQTNGTSTTICDLSNGDSSDVNKTQSLTPRATPPVEGVRNLEQSTVDSLQDDKNIQEFPFLSIFKWATPLEYLFQCIGLVMALACGAALPLITVVTGDMVNTFGSFIFSGTPSLGPAETSEEFISKVSGLALDLVYIGVGVFISSYVANVCWIVTGERISRRIRGSYLKAVLSQSIVFFDYLGTGEITNRISHDIDLIQDGISDKIAITAQALSTLSSSFIIAFTRSWRFTLNIFWIVPTMLFLSAVGGILLSKLSTKVIREYNMAATLAQEVLSSIRTAQAMGAEEKLAHEYNDNLAAAQRAGYKTAILSGVMFAPIFATIYFTYGLAFWKGSQFVADGNLNIGIILTCLFAIVMASLSLSLIAPRIGSFSKAKAAAQQVFKTISMVSTIDTFSSKGGKPALIDGNIELRNVSFAYPCRSEVPVLKNISLSIPAGKFTAIVGPSGSGKSTIIQLLERFYDPLQGEISLDGHNLTDLNVRYLRTQMRLVSQEPVLFACSIYENICHGMIETELHCASEEEKRAAVKQSAIIANADEFICDLPDGYDTIVGEHGLLLSGGQKQRIAIARAIISDPKILLLDEATSALDTDTERLVQRALDQASQFRTTVCIAHRLSTIKHADRIIVMKSGEIVEQGTHVELLNLCGVYKGLLEAQGISIQQKGEEIDAAISEDGDEKFDIVDPATQTNTADADYGSSKRSGEKVEDIQNPRLGLEMTESVSPTRSSYTKLVIKVLQWNKGEYALLTTALLTTLLTGGVYPAQALLYSYYVTALVNPDLSAMKARANFLSLWWIMIAIIEFLAYLIQGFGFGYSSEKMLRRVRFNSFRAILRQDIAFFDKPEHSTGSLTRMLSTEASAMSGLSGTNLGCILTLFVNLAGCIILAITYDWKLGLVATSLFPLTVSAGYLRFSMLNKLNQKLQKVYTHSACMVCEQVASMRTVASLNREVALQEEFMQSLKAPVLKAMYFTLKITSVYPFFPVVCFGTMPPFFYKCIDVLVWKQIVNNSATRPHTILNLVHDSIAGSAEQSFMALTIGSQAAGQLYSFAPDIAKAQTSAIAINDLLERTPVIDTWSKDGKPIKEIEVGHLQFIDVHFRYPSRPLIHVLQGLDFEIKPGQHVALVGSSGCGKSTAAALIERFYNPLMGVVLVDGIRVQEYNLRDYRNNIGFVSQEPTLYQGTIRFNILLGNIRSVSQAELDEVCKDANILDFIQSLPEGYETMVGSRGAALSGGQKQRIAIARALIRNPKILILDEATSALDTGSEQVVQEALNKAARGRTTLTIAHRLSTIQNVDMIYFLEKGRVVEKGRHYELVALRGRYFQLAQQQKLQNQGEGF